MTEDQYENSAVYVFNRNAARHHGATDAEAHAAGVRALEESAYGVGYKTDKHGNALQSGIGSLNNENGNHYAAILKWEGKAAWEKAIREIWRRNPDRALKLGLPQPPRLGA